MLSCCQRIVEPSTTKQARKTLFRTIAIGTEIELNSVETKRNFNLLILEDVSGEVGQCDETILFAKWHLMKLGSYPPTEREREGHYIF